MKYFTVRSNMFHSFYDLVHLLAPYFLPHVNSKNKKKTNWIQYSRSFIYIDNPLIWLVDWHMSVKFLWIIQAAQNNMRRFNLGWSFFQFMVELIVFYFRAVKVKKASGRDVLSVKPYIIDLESSNGTFLNNQKLEPRRLVFDLRSFRLDLYKINYRIGITSYANGM